MASAWWYFEEVHRHLGTAAGHAYGGYLAHLTAWAEANKIPYQGVPVGTIKRHIAGKGNADKAAVIDAVRKLGFQPADDNEADALALLTGRSRRGSEVRDEPQPISWPREAERLGCRP